MPLTRQEARANLVSLIQQQVARPSEHGDLLVAVWHDIEDAAQDLHLLEVFESFCAPDGSGMARVRFPGMAGLWLPGLYFVTLFSGEAFEGELMQASPFLAGIEQQLRAQRAELLFVNPAAIPPHTALANWISRA